jgi:hypothetical protein
MPTTNGERPFAFKNAVIIVGTANAFCLPKFDLADRISGKNYLNVQHRRRYVTGNFYRKYITI